MTGCFGGASEPSEGGGGYGADLVAREVHQPEVVSGACCRPQGYTFQTPIGTVWNKKLSGPAAEKN